MGKFEWNGKSVKKLFWKTLSIKRPKSVKTISLNSSSLKEHLENRS